MLDNFILNKKSIEGIYKTICEYHEKYLKQYGVKLPKLHASKGRFTKDALVLVYYDERVTPRENQIFAWRPSEVVKKGLIPRALGAGTYGRSPFHFSPTLVGAVRYPLFGL